MDSQTNKKPMPKWKKVGLIIVGILVLGAISGANNNNDSAKQEGSPKSTAQITKVEEKNPVEEAPKQEEKYKQLSYDKNRIVENYNFLYTDEDKTETTITAVAEQIKKSKCKMACNIGFYDDEKAYSLEKEMQKITDPIAKQNWNMKNYVFVAEHFLGYMSFEDGVGFLYYPYKDWQYKELKK